MRSALEILAAGLVVVVLIIIIPNLAAISAGLALFGYVFLQWLQLLLYGVLIVAGGSAIIAAYVVIDKRRELRVRQQDGSFPLMEFRRGSARVIVDPNKMVGSGGVFHESVGWQELLPAAGWEIASRHSAAVQMTRTAQAIAPGDNAILGMDRYRPPTIPAAAVNPRAIPAQLRAEMEEPPDIEAPRLPAPVIAPSKLIEGNQQSRFAIGQDVKTGDPAFWDLQDDPHIRIHGSTQSGKTALARFIVTQVLRGNGEVTVLDRRRFKDWGIFRGRARLIDARRTQVFIRHLEEHVARYEERDALLGQHNAPTLEALAAKTGKAPVRSLFVVEEIGMQLVEAQSMGATVYGKVLDNLARLASEAGATGIHLLFLDQMPDEWHKRVRYNLSPMIFHLPDHGGKSAGYQMAYDLPKYHCWFNGQIIRTGYMDEGEIVDALSVRSVDIEADEPYFDAPPNTEDRTFGANGEDAPLNPAEVKAAIFAHLDANPDATQADIRATLGSSRAWTNACWHEWHNHDGD